MQATAVSDSALALLYRKMSEVLATELIDPQFDANRAHAQVLEGHWGGPFLARRARASRNTYDLPMS